MKSKKNAELICQLCEDFDKMKEIQKSFVGQLDEHHAHLLEGSRRLVIIRNVLQDHVIDREFHIPTTKITKRINPGKIDFTISGKAKKKHRASKSANMKLNKN